MNDCRKRHTNLGISWIDHKKPYDMIPHSRILESLKLVIFKLVSESFVHFIRKSIKNWNIKVSSSYVENIWERLISEEVYFRETVTYATIHL